MDHASHRVGPPCVPCFKASVLPGFTCRAAPHVIASSGLNALQRKVIDLEPIRRFLDEKIELPILGDDPSDASRPRVFSAAPISLAGADDGYLYIVFRSFSSDTLAQRIKQSYVLRETLWLVGTGLLAALFAGALIIMRQDTPRGSDGSSLIRTRLESRFTSALRILRLLYC